MVVFEKNFFWTRFALNYFQYCTMRSAFLLISCTLVDALRGIMVVKICVCPLYDF